jgi:hypothetical protein
MNRQLLNRTLDDLAPAQGEIPTWEDILDRAGIEGLVSTRRPLWKRSWVIALAVLVAVLVPLAVIGSQENWWFLDNGSPKPGMPRPVSAILEVKSGSWSGHDWQLAAYRTFVHRGGTGPGIEGVCYSSQVDHGRGGTGACTPIPSQLPGVSSESSAPNSISFFGGPFNTRRGATDKTGYVFGMVPGNVTDVNIHFKDGRATDAPTFAAPEALGASVRFFGVELSEYGLFLSISKLVGLNGQGEIAACTAINRPKPSATCS